MALFKYIAASSGEKPHEMLIEADNSYEALRKLRSRKLIPVKFLGEAAQDGINKGFSLKKTNIDTFEFTRQLSPLLASYIPLEAALGIIAEGTPPGSQHDFVQSLRQGLHEGKKFSDLIHSHGSLFPDYYANLIESGEETGCLPEVVNHLYSFMGESRELKNYIVSSAIYPVVIICITLLVAVLLFTVFVPKFAGIFTDMGKGLPSSMTFLMTLSDIASYAWWGIPILLVIAWKCTEMLIGKEQLRYHIYSFQLKIPLLSRIIIDLEMCKYLHTLSIMLSNHVEIIRTVKIAFRIIHNPVMAEAFQDIPNKLKAGNKLSAALSGNPYIPREMVPMLRVGEESGTVGEMLTKIALNLENETRVKIKRLLSLFEPMVIVFLAMIVLVVVASIFMALMDMNQIN